MMEICIGKPLNRVLHGINHYISTGDLMGEGIAIPFEDKLKIVVLVNTTLPTDVENWCKLKSKLEDISRPAFVLEGHGITPPHFDAYTITVAESDLDAFADSLMEKPGPLGWGSTKELIDRYGLQPWV